MDERDSWKDERADKLNERAVQAEERVVRGRILANGDPALHAINFCTLQANSFFYLCPASFGSGRVLIEAEKYWRFAYDLKLYLELTF
ncbi:MAG TPA: hypothetical protein VHS96_11525 [Bacteroidia bacterium]|nr:hypothetical protein [Bacteroidia bacterium]